MMKIEFELEMSPVEAEIVKHLAHESGVSIQELLKRASAVYISSKITERKQAIASMLAARSDIDDAILEESKKVAAHRAPSW